MKYEEFLAAYNAVREAFKISDHNQAISTLKNIQHQFEKFQWSKHNQVDQDFIWRYLEELIQDCDALIDQDEEVESIQNFLQQVHQKSSLSSFDVHTRLLKKAVKDEQIEYHLKKVSTQVYEEALLGQLRQKTIEPILAIFSKLTFKLKASVIIELEKTLAILIKSPKINPSTVSELYMLIARLYYAQDLKKTKTIFDNYLPLSGNAFTKSMIYFAKNNPNVAFLVDHYVNLSSNLPQPLQALLHDQLYYYLVYTLKFTAADLIQHLEDNKLTPQANGLLREFAFMHPRSETHSLLVRLIALEFQKKGDLTANALEKFFITQIKFAPFKRVFNYHHPRFSVLSLPLLTGIRPLSNDECQTLIVSSVNVPTIHAVIKKLVNYIPATAVSHNISISPTKATSIQSTNLKSAFKEVKLLFDAKNYSKTLEALNDLRPNTQLAQEIAVWENKIQEECQKHLEKLEKIVRVRKSTEASTEEFNAAAKSTEQLLKASINKQFYLRVKHEEIALKILRIRKENNLCRQQDGENGPVLSVNIGLVEEIRSELEIILPMLDDPTDAYYTLGCSHYLCSIVLNIMVASAKIHHTLNKEMETFINVIKLHDTKAIEYYQKTLLLDSTNMQARWLLAETYNQLSIYDVPAQKELYTNALTNYTLIQDFAATTGQEKMLLASLFKLYFINTQLLNHNDAYNNVIQLIQMVEPMGKDTIDADFNICFSLSRLYILAGISATKNENHAAAIPYFIKARKQVNTAAHFDCIEFSYTIKYCKNKSELNHLSFNSIEEIAPSICVYGKEFYFYDYDSANNRFGKQIALDSKKFQKIFANYAIPTDAPENIKFDKQLILPLINRAVCEAVGERSVYLRKYKEKALDLIQIHIQQCQNISITDNLQHFRFLANTTPRAASVPEVSAASEGDVSQTTPTNS